jgi:uncharacterized protein YbaR (Trm112 family)
MISKELLEFLCCPACRGELDGDPARNTLICRACGRSYRVEGKIPVMIVEEEPKKR